MVSLQAVPHRLGLVILADHQLAAAAVADALDLAGFGLDVVAGAALLADAAAAHPVKNHVLVHGQVQNLVDPDAHPLDGLGLGDGAGHAVQDEALGAVGLCQPLFQDADDDIIRHKAAGVHVTLGLQAHLGALLDGGPQDVAGGDGRDAQLGGEDLGLGALARTRGA